VIPLSSYLAHVRHDGTIRITDEDHDRPDVVVRLPPAGSLRDTLEEAGWRPTGRRPRSGRWDLIYVEPTTHNRSSNRRRPNTSDQHRTH
jgi:hypothetical protein